MGLKDIGETLPPGFRFYPSDEELVCHYLHKKIANEAALKGTLVEIDLHTCEPWQLPDMAKLNGSEWYFFSFRDRKYATGFRTNRATASGYWKATGKDRIISDPNTRQVVGMRKTLVFYRSRAPNGFKTGWIMHEFRLEAPHTPPKEDWVLCRVFYKSKGESHNSPHLFDSSSTTTTTSPPPTLASPPQPDAQGTAIAYGYQRSDPFNMNPSPQAQTYTRTQDPDSLCNSTMLSPSPLMQILKDGVNPYSAMINCSFNDVIMMDDDQPSKFDDDEGLDDYGLLWDVGFQEINNLGHGATSHSHHLHHHYDQLGDHVYGVN